MKEVQLVAEITFNSGVLEKPSIETWKRTLNPTDRLYLHHECTNRDCTSYGFDLTSALARCAAAERKIGSMQQTLAVHA